MSHHPLNTTQFPNQPPPGQDELCTLATCPLSRSIFNYRPILALSAAPLALFAVLGIAHIVVGYRKRTWWFMSAVLIGCLLEVIGYIGRILASSNPFPMSYYLLQICLLTLSPVLFCAGIYLTLGKIVVIYAPNLSRIPPVWYPRIFLSCDLVSLILQGSGGAIAASANTQEGSQVGVNVMLGGLSFQVATLIAFSSMAIDFGLRVRKQPEQASDNSTFELRNSKGFKAFLISLGMATLLILVRSIYRVIEMAEGYHSTIMNNQWTFLVFEALLVIIAVFLLLVLHPGFYLPNDTTTRKVEEKESDAEP